MSAALPGCFYGVADVEPGGGGGSAASESGAAAGTGASCDAACGASACAGAVDAFAADVLAYIPCAASFDDVTGRSTVTIEDNPTISSSPAGAPEGHSCSLGSTGGRFSGRGFTVAMPASLGTGDFTIEFAVYQTAWHDPSDQASQVLISNSTFPQPPSVQFPSFWSGDAKDGMQFDGGGIIYLDSGASLAKWERFAASRVSGTTRVFRDGVLLTSIPDATDYTDDGFDVGYQRNGDANAVIGSIAEIRVTAAGRYTSSYTVCAGGFATP
ncbi:MAG TPA: hypothetical protein VGM56_19550 [Byssovorax sp.]